MTVAAGKKQLAKREIRITRVFDAPRALVFRAWTDPKMLARWWGPRGFTNPVCEFDPRPGGRIWIVMRASEDMKIPNAEGADFPMSGIVREIVPPGRLVFTCVAEDKAGKPLIEALTTVTFAEEGGKTRVTVVASGVAVAEIGSQMIEGMEEGWNQSIDRLGELLQTL